MRAAGIQGVCHRRKGRHRPAPAVHEDLVQRKFVAEAPDQLWCTDVTEHSTRDGKVYCCAVLDVFSRRIVGWSIADHIRSELVVDALQMATWRRQPDPGAIVHSDRGSVIRVGSLGTDCGRRASSVPWAESPHRSTTR
jgi:transposase InsO family protein